MAIEKKPKYPVLCPQGKTFSLAVYVKNPATNAVIDLTGYKARVEVRSILPGPSSTAGDADVILSLTSEAGDITITPGSGRIHILISATATSSLPVGTYFWDIEIEDSDGNVPYFMEPSKFKVLPENTLSENP